MGKRSWFLHLACAGAVAGSLVAPGVRGAGADCAPVAERVDTTSWNVVPRTFLGKAIGQTFYARDTLISRITVWRPPNNLDGGMLNRLFVTAVDTADYDPPRPITTAIIQNGPAIAVRDSDPPGLPVRMDYVLDPPLALPYPGTYAFFIQREGCDWGETAAIAKGPDAYPFGTFWFTGRTAGLSCHLAAVTSWEDFDLCFEIEYCREVATLARQQTWGELKVIYR